LALSADWKRPGALALPLADLCAAAPAFGDNLGMTVSRRDFTRLFAIGGSAALFAHAEFAVAQSARGPFSPRGTAGSERFWTSVREQFVMPPELAVMNAANLCPSSRPVLEAMYGSTRDMDQDPSPSNRAKLGPAKEATRKKVAAFLRVSPDEIVLTRNTSESNNLVSSGLDLKAGDEVVLFGDNHPSNLQAWREKSKRFGYAVKIVEAVSPHPGFDYYIAAVAKALTPQTKVLAFTHLTSTVGDLLPAGELCRLARDRGVMTLVDGAQSAGLLDVDLGAMQPAFYTASAHKWPCGPKEAGLLFINARVHAKIWPTLYSAYPGAVGISRTFEGFGQRDDPALIAFGEALDFQAAIGRVEIERRARALTQALIGGLKRLDGVQLWTHPSEDRSAAIVSFKPGSLDPRKLAAVLHEKDRIACATRGGADRPGLRFSPHIYNSPAEVDRVLAALTRYLKAGV
jgi:isopenicillin-N epimerase